MPHGGSCVALCAGCGVLWCGVEWRRGVWRGVGRRGVGGGGKVMDKEMERDNIMHQIILICCLGLAMMKKKSLIRLNKQILMMWMIMSKKVLADMENEFSTGIRELGNSKISDENELFDYLSKEEISQRKPTNLS